MADYIIPLASPATNGPLMLTNHRGNSNSGGAATIGTIRSSSDKPAASLDLQAVLAATACQVNDNIAGTNGRRFTAGLSATDLSNAVTGVHLTGNAPNRLDINDVASAGMVMYFMSTTGAFDPDTSTGDGRVWTVRGEDSSIGNFLGYDAYVIDPSVAGTVSDIGTFVATSVDQWGWAVDTQGGYSSNYCWFFITNQWRVLKTSQGAVGMYGASPSPTFAGMHASAVTVAWVVFEKATGLFQIVAPFKIGDDTNGNTVTYSESDITLFTPVGQADGGADQFHVDDTSFPFWLDLDAADSVTMTRMTFIWGQASPFDFDTDVSAGATVSLVDCVFTGMGDFTLGADTSCVAVFTLATGSDVIINGADLDGSTINGDCQLTTDTDFTDITITGDLRIDIGADATLDFSNVTVTGTVFNDDAASTLTINASDGSSLTADDAGTGNGQENILNTVTLTVTALDTDASAIENVRMSLEADTGGALAAGLTTTITRVTTTATATATAHGLATGDTAIVRGAVEDNFNGIHQSITVTGANTYTYTVADSGATTATGSPTTTAQILTGLTNASGIITTAGFNFGANQPVIGRLRKGTSSPTFKTAGVVGTITSSGFTAVITMVSDE